MINEIKQDIFQISFKEFGSTVYVLKLKDKNILIDTTSEENRDELINTLQELDLTTEKITHVILTHNHWDHIGNNNLFKKAKILDYQNKEEIQNLIPDIQVIDAKGHTQTDICLLYKDILFSGDVIFHNNGVGRTDFEESNPNEMEKSLEKLSKLKYNILCPGHID